MRSSRLRARSKRRSMRIATGVAEEEGLGAAVAAAVWWGEGERSVLVVGLAEEVI